MLLLFCSIYLRSSLIISSYSDFIRPILLSFSELLSSILCSNDFCCFSCSYLIRMISVLFSSLILFIWVYFYFFTSSNFDYCSCSNFLYFFSLQTALFDNILYFIIKSLNFILIYFSMSQDSLIFTEVMISSYH